MRDAVANVSALAAVLKQAPQLIERGARLMEGLSEVQKTLADGTANSPRYRRGLAIPLWIGAGALIIIAVKLLLG